MGQPQAFFLPAKQGKRFCLFTPASGAKRKGAILYIHPFAEELNKTRRVAALQASAMAAAGYSVLQIDFYGCGDSAGEFADASWEDWLDDVGSAYAWLKEQSDAPIWFWGLRTGCLLAASAASLLGEPLNFLFWQPVISGKAALQQFLRIAVIGEMLDGHGKGVMAALRSRIDQGTSVEVAGYELSSTLARGLEGADLMPPGSGGGRLILCEISGRETDALSPVGIHLLEQWQTAGFQASARSITASAFWQTQEANDAPELIEATVKALDQAA